MNALLVYGLLFKIALTASIVVIASVAVERSGPMLGAMIASLPTSGGAAFIILAWDHSPIFIAESATGALMSNAGVLALAIAFAVSAQRYSLSVALGIGLVCWFALLSLMRLYDWTMPAAISLNVAILGVAIPLGRRFRLPGSSKPVRTTVLDIAWRTALVAALVVAVTGLSNSIGAILSGVFSFFPVALVSFLIIIHRRLGPSSASNVAARFPSADIGLALAIIEVHYLAPVIGVWWSYLVAITLCIAWNAVLWVASRMWTSL